jgi:nucleolar complex protein 2
MGKKAPKSAKKFAASGQLKKVIQARHKHQQQKKRTQHRRGNKGGADAKAGRDEDEEVQEKVQENREKSKRGVKSVDDFLSGSFMDDEDDEGEGGSDDEMAGEDSDEGEGDSDVEDDDDFTSVDDLEDEGANHLIDLSKLAEKDPEFYQYLQENDRELLEFDLSNAQSGDDEDADEDMDDEDISVPVLTRDILKRWQKAILEHRSLRALRKLLIAFRSAVHMNEEGQVVAWKIDNSLVYDKLVVTALRYTPVVLEHHAPCKKLPSGRIKPPTQTLKLRSLQKMIISYFQNITHLLSQLSEQSELLKIAVTESAKVIPYVASSRRAVKAYVKKCLELWSTSSVPDETRISAYLAVRSVADIGDDNGAQGVMKNMYLTLVRSCKLTTAYTISSINLMKNSAAEMFCRPNLSGTAYQLAFGYIRQLAIHLRNSIKVKSKESYKLVYNWQFVHCIDFWCTVLAKSCDKASEQKSGKESELKPLIYPLVQVALGAVKLIPNSRSYPLHLHLLRSLVHLVKHTHTYVPIFPFILPILSFSLSHKPKNSTLKPLDLESTIRCPAQYNKTRIYVSSLVEEAVFVLAEYLCSDSIRCSIAFPEVCVTIQVSLRKVIKSAGSNGASLGKETGIVKNFVERIDDASKWIDAKRANLAFGPAQLDLVRKWEEGIRKEEGPLGKYIKVLYKARDARRKLMEKAREGEDEIVGEEDDEEDEGSDMDDDDDSEDDDE